MEEHGPPRSDGIDFLSTSSYIYIYSKGKLIVNTEIGDLLPGSVNKRVEKLWTEPIWRARGPAKPGGASIWPGPLAVLASVKMREGRREKEERRKDRTGRVARKQDEKKRLSIIRCLNKLVGRACVLLDRHHPVL